MIDVKDQVSMMFGKEVADALDAEGLLASWTDKLQPWQWRVRVKDTGLVVLPIDRGVPRVPRNLGRGLSEPLWKYQYPGHNEDVMSGWQDFDTLGTARKQANMARKVGLFVRIRALALVEIGDVE